MPVRVGFDRYERKARVMPGLIVLLPIGAAAYAWLRGDALKLSLLESFGISGALTAAIALLVAQLARAMGKSREKELWKSWGGPPTATLLRHANNDLASGTRARYHKKLGALLNLSLPTREAEHADPIAAGDIYDSCVDFLIANTRDPQRFYLVAEENANYGFHRNLWAMKGVGLALAIIGTIASATLVIRSWFVHRIVDSVGVVTILLSFMLLLVWLIWITPAWVRTSAVTYAKVLLATAEQLEAARHS